MKYDTEKMIDMLEKAKNIVCDVYNATDNFDVGNVLCSIDEATASLEHIQKVK